MKITLDISLYPLDADYIPAIKSFVRELRKQTQIEIVTNQMSTQVRGEFDVVWAAVNAGMKQSMAGGVKCMFVTKCLNADLEIGRLPVIE
jgi:uncharacterized protein YqgV (UPF0045/DUF77 family)